MLRLPLQTQRAFTLVELVIVSAGMAIFGGVMFVAIQSGSILYAKNYSVNETNNTGRNTLGRMTRDIHMSIEAPSLVDEAGATVAGSPAAGVRFRKYVAGPLMVNSAITAASTTATLTLRAGDRMPRIGDLLALPQVTLSGSAQDVYIRITAVSPAAPATSTSPTVTFVSAAGNWTTPVAASGTLCAIAGVAHIVREVAYIVAPGVAPAATISQLRYYDRALSVAADGSAAYQNSLNYTVLISDMTGAVTPFSAAPGARALSVALQVMETKYSQRISNRDVKVLNLGTSANPHTIPYKSIGL
jgi:hypothetical protein